jgi:hypothetical protein
MAAESAYYTWLLESLPGADYTRTKVREVANDVQNEVLASRDGRLMLIKPEPYLVVVSSSIKRYVANTSIVSQRDGVTTFDVRRIRRVYAFTDASNPHGSYGGYGSGSQPFPAYQKNYMAIPEIDMPVESQDSVKPLAGDCVVDFHKDFSPAASTELYNVQAWAWPEQLTSENITIKIPIQFRKTLLLFGVLSKIETRDFGRDDTIAKKYEQALADWHRYDEVGAANFRIQRTPPREC